MTDIPKLFADFKNADRQGRARFNTKGTFADIKRLNLELKEGMQVLPHDDDSLKTVGQLKYSDKGNICVAEINLDTLK